MILTCPQCGTRYQTDAAKFQPAGRTVRCAKCAHVWHQEAPAPEPDIADDIAVVEMPPAASALMPETPPIAAFMPNPVIARRPMNEPEASEWPHRIGVAAGWLGLIAIILLIGWAALTWRRQIATLWPQSASLYASVGLKTNASGIDIQDVAYHRGTEDGQSVLSVSGILTNSSPRELPVPQLRVALIDDDRHELYHWTFAPGVTTLHSGQSAKFLTRLSNPPEGARHFELRFAKAGE